MHNYNLGFIADKDIYEHVRNTVMLYRRTITLKDFNKNIIDPIKLTFDAKIYGQTMAQTIESECLRQIDKANNNHIGYFHQNLFRYAGNGWEVPSNGEQGGFDVINNQRHVFAEIKNKHNTMNAASASDTYVKMQSKILHDSDAVCFLVEVISKKSQDIPWSITINENGRKQKYEHDKIHRISMDKFYEFVFGDATAFFRLCKTLPTILEDVVADDNSIQLQNTVYSELDTSDFFKSLYLLAFQSYEGFNSL